MDGPETGMGVDFAASALKRTDDITKQAAVGELNGKRQGELGRANKKLERKSPRVPEHITAFPCVRATGYCRVMAQCALQNYSAQHSARYGSGSWVCNPMS